MKIKPEHFEHLKKAIQPFDIPERRAQYLKGGFPRADVVKDLDMRYRWDLIYEAGLSQWACDNLYSYMDDDHIDTALRQIVPPLKPTEGRRA